MSRHARTTVHRIGISSGNQSLTRYALSARILIRNQLLYCASLAKNLDERQADFPQAGFLASERRCLVE